MEDSCCSKQRSGWLRYGYASCTDAYNINEGKRYLGLCCKGITPGLLGTAIFIIGCLGAAGVMTTGAMTGAVIGLGAAAIACTLVNGGFATASTWFQIMKYATLIALAAIAMTTHMLSSVQLGYGLLGTSLGGFGLICAAMAVEIKCGNKDS